MAKHLTALPPPGLPLHELFACVWSHLKRIQAKPPLPRPLPLDLLALYLHHHCHHLPHQIIGQEGQLTKLRCFQRFESVLGY